MPTLRWIKSTENQWLPLNTFNIDGINTDFGVYVIWHGSPSPWTVRVGQGDIADRLSCHREDYEVQAYKTNGGLWVTWAAVAPVQADGIERYLADELRPKVGTRWPNVTPLPVNLPWAA
jgi:hypothetical protein